MNIHEPIIGKEQLSKATDMLQRYKSGKANLERRIVADEEWWRLRHWDHIPTQSKHPQVEAASSWLFNVILNKQADALQAYPMPNILPQEEGDKAEAKMLSSIIPVVLRRDGFEHTYEQVVTRKLISGTGIYGVYWDPTLLNGLGDITITAVNPLNIFPEPGVSDIQDSRNIFVCELADNAMLADTYPDKAAEIEKGSGALTLTEYRHDDSVDTSDKSLVVHWYYKKVVGGRTVLHYCKYTGETVLYASENDPRYAERGYYHHGKYPFVFTTLFEIADSPWGFGYVDVGKNAQERIDRLNRAIVQNALLAATPRYFVRQDGNVNEAEFADLSKPLVHVSGSMGQESLQPIETPTLPSVCLEVMNGTIQELRETSGNTEAASGVKPSGVTAASAIAALQQAAGKTSAAATRGEYRAYEQIIMLCIELVRQFYDAPRKFRITGGAGEDVYVTYSNRGLQPQQLVTGFGVPDGYRLPEFDIEVSAEQNSVYTRVSQNELALQLYNAGAFNPQNVDQSLMLLQAMDFPRKEQIIREVKARGDAYARLQQYQQLALMLAQQVDPAKADGIAQDILKSGGQVVAGRRRMAATDAVRVDGEDPEEHAVVRNARRLADEAADVV